VKNKWTKNDSIPREKSIEAFDSSQIGFIGEISRFFMSPKEEIREAMFPKKFLFFLFYLKIGQIMIHRLGGFF